MVLRIRLIKMRAARHHIKRKNADNQFSYYYISSVVKCVIIIFFSSSSSSLLLIVGVFLLQQYYFFVFLFIYNFFTTFSFTYVSLLFYVCKFVVFNTLRGSDCLLFGILKCCERIPKRLPLRLETPSPCLPPSM